MERQVSIAVLIASLLFCSSCKKSDISNSIALQNSKKNINVDIFTDVSELEAKRLVGHRSYKVDERKLLTNKQLQGLRDLARTKEAKLSDIPIPLNVDPLDDFLDSSYSEKEIVLGYHSNMSTDDIFRFYKQEMERLGWQNVASFDEYEKMFILNFTKPSKFCSVLIRKCSCDDETSQEHSDIIIFTKR